MIDMSGPAYPCMVERHNGSMYPSYGLTIRDHFAGMAMQAVMTSDGPTWRDSGFKPIDGLSIMENNAVLAYAAADAMLKARARINTGADQ